MMALTDNISSLPRCENKQIAQPKTRLMTMVWGFEFTLDSLNIKGMQK